MKTTELIEQLSTSAEPVSSADRVSIYFLKWVAAAVGASTLWLIILPFRDDLSLQLATLRFFLESMTWLALAGAAGLVAYRTRLPGLDTRLAERIAGFIGFVLLIEIFAQSSGASIREELQGEMSWYRGRCGPLIILMALSWSGGLFYWMKQGASVTPAKSGAWAAISAAALSAFVMQLICAHENTVHLLIWHVIPTALLGFAGFSVGRRMLRW